MRNRVTAPPVIVYLLGICLLFLIQSGWAQPTKPQRKTGEIEDAEVVIEKNRAITLPEADRNFEKIPATAVKVAPALQPYQLSDFNAKLTDLNPKFRVLQMPAETQPEQHGNYLKAGVGMYGGLYGEGWLNSTQNTDYSFGAHAKHLSFRTGPVDKANSGTNEDAIDLYGKYFAGGITAGASIGFNREKYYFYGYRPGTVDRDNESRKAIKQVFNTFSFKTSFANNLSDSPLDYKLNINAFNLSDNYKANEFEFSTNLDLKYALTDQLSALANADLYLTRVKNVYSANRNLFRIKPRVQYSNGDKLTIWGGINVVYQNDSLGSNPAINLFPVGEVSFAFTEGFSVFAGIDGDIQRTSLRLLVDENPWLAPKLPLVNTQKARELYGGLKGRLGGNLGFAVRMGYSGYKNLYFYTNSARDTTKFTLLYDPDFTNVLNFSGELAYNAAEKFRLAVKADYFNYSTRNVTQAWHRPTFTASLLGKYNLNQKLSFNTEIYYLGGIIATQTYRTGGVFIRDNLTDRKKELDPIVDLNFKVDYAVSDKIGAYISLNNVLNKKYQRFLHYPTRGFTFMIGGSYSF